MSGAKISWRVSGKLYGTLNDAQRTLFIAGALDTLELVEPSLWAEHRARVRAVIHYARLDNLDALRTRFDDYVKANEERLIAGAANNLFIALGEWCGYKPAAAKLQLNQLAKIVSLAASMAAGLLAAAISTFVVRGAGGGKTATLIVSFAIIMVWAVAVAPWLYRKIVAASFRSSFWRDMVFEKMAHAPSDVSYAVKPALAPRLTSQQYAKLAERLQLAFAIGVTDVLCFSAIYVMPQNYAKFDAIARGISPFTGRDLQSQLQAYFDSHEYSPQAGAAARIFGAIEDWSVPAVAQRVDSTASIPTKPR